MHPDKLNAEILLVGYAQGCFPMPDEQLRHINWYRPDPRAIIPLDGFHVSQSLQRFLKQTNFEVRYDTCFQEVMLACGERPETWITDAFLRAYVELHKFSHAHSVEVFREDKLVGGVYGVSIGGVFFAESMFHRETNMSKVALKALVDHLKMRGFILLECQFMTPHLQTLGAIEIPDSEYMSELNRALRMESVLF